MLLQIGPYLLPSRLMLAPMAGITDRPYRDVCRHYGAGLTTSEMVTSDPRLFHSRKTQLRLVQTNEPSPRAAQILGTEPTVMADAARFNVDHGADIIDINMGCPAKKVCSKAAGSALMKDTKLVTEILQQIIQAVDVPVTLKIRTGWANSHKNALDIANIAEQQGISCLVVHGRTRHQAFMGHAEYETIRQIKDCVSIPVIANGDIHSTEDAQFIFDYTQVDGLMLGRITHGKPWVFKEINQQLSLNKAPSSISLKTKINTVLEHIDAIHRYYGTDQGVRIARKHIGWYLFTLVGQDLKLLKHLKQKLFVVSDASEQLKMLRDILQQL